MSEELEDKVRDMEARLNEAERKLRVSAIRERRPLTDRERDIKRYGPGHVFPIRQRYPYGFYGPKW